MICLSVDHLSTGIDYAWISELHPPSFILKYYSNSIKTIQLCKVLTMVIGNFRMKFSNDYNFLSFLDFNIEMMFI